MGLLTSYTTVNGSLQQGLYVLTTDREYSFPQTEHRSTVASEGVRVRNFIAVR
ncbi:MAG: hypothetical protein ICV81_02130 [Flavisolibacter sp.]|nr:hypothetical protein [Flavisolibacter sp.]